MEDSTIRLIWNRLALPLCVTICSRASAFNTVLDPHGLPLLASARISRSAPTGGGGLGGVHMLPLGSFTVQHLSTVIEDPDTFRSAVDAASAQLADTNRDAYGDLPSDPIVVIDGHWCPFSLEDTAKKGHRRYKLRDPYAWESVSDADAFLIPQWLLQAIGGDPGGGALLTYTNGSSVAEATKVESKGGGWIPAPSHDLTQSVPSLQIASWRKGFFKSLMTLSSTTLLLGEEQRKGMEGGSQAIRTASGDLEIAPAADVQITAGRKANGGKVRIDATGPNGTIALHSDQLYWTMSASNSSSLLDSVEHGDIHEGGTHQARRVHHDDHSRTAMMRVGADGLNVHEMTTVNLSARSFFSLAVVGTPRPVREVIHGGTISGDERSVNISGGAVGVKALTDFVEISGATGASLSSHTGNVRLHSNNGTSSLLVSINNILATAETVTLRGSRARGMTTSSQTSSTEAYPSRGGEAKGGEPRGSEGPDGSSSGGFITLTSELATLGSSSGASLDIADEVRLRANDSSLVRLSHEGISLATTVLVLRSSSTPIHATLPPDRDSPVRQPPSPGRRPPSEDSVVRLDDGIIGMDAPKSLEFETPGAMITLSGRCDGDSGREGKYSSKHHEHGRTSAKVCAQGDRGRLSADADVVEIFGTSPAGVTIAAGGVGGTTTQLGHTEEARQRHSETMTGGRIEVMSDGVISEGTSASVRGSRKVLLQVTERATKTEGSGTTSPKSATPLDGEDGSRVELNGSGVEVVAPSSQSVSIRAGSRVVLDTPELAISHGSDAAVLGSKSGKHGSIPGSGNGLDGSGFWSNGPSLTGRADRFVLFQAGKTSDGKRKPASAKTASSSRVSIEEGLIRIRAGGQSTAFEPTGRAPMGTDGASEEAGALPLDRRGLSITSVGTANFSSSEVMNFLAEEFMVYSSNQTAVYSPGGIFIAGSVPPNGDTVETTRTVQPRRGMQKLRGHILMAPGAGSGVGIGPGFSSRDLQESKPGAVPNLLYITNSTNRADERLAPPRDAHLAVESSGDAAISLLSPRGWRSAVRFGSTGLPYSGGLSLQHNRDGPSGDTLLLELASSPGRIVGDSLGRWAVGAVTKEGPAATLHVLAVPKAPIASGSVDTKQPAIYGDTDICVVAVIVNIFWRPGKRNGGLRVVARADAAISSAPSLLVESQVPATAVIQLLSTLAAPHTPADNALVLTSRHSGNKKQDVYDHWALSQLGRHGARTPSWIDTGAHSSSWRGGLVLAHAIGDDVNGWRSGVRAAASATEPVNGLSSTEAVVAFGTDGRSGFGTGSTGARVTIGGAILVEQVLILSDKGIVRDINQFGEQGREQAMDAIRNLDVASYGWTKEASHAYGLEPDFRQVGLVAQQVEKVAPSLVWKDPSTGRKAVSHSRVLLTLLAAFQHLDSDVRTSEMARDDRLARLEARAEAIGEGVSTASEKLGSLEATVSTALETLRIHNRETAALEGRVSEQGKRLDILSADVSAVQETVAIERGENQVWRSEQSAREMRLTQEVRELTIRLTALEEKRQMDLEDQTKRLQAHDEQIRAFNIRLGAYQEAQASCESSLEAQVEKLQYAHKSLEDLLGLLQPAPDKPKTPHTQEDFFFTEVLRIEDRLRAELQDGNGDKNVEAQLLLERRHLEKHKAAVMAEALETSRRHQEHVNALRKMGGG